MLPNSHTDKFPGNTNKTGMTGEIINRDITYQDSYGGDYRIIRGTLNGISVVETHTVDSFGGGSCLETLDNYNTKMKRFDEICSKLV